MPSIISISGERGSGKDAIASILVDEYGFQKLAFADSVKDSLSVIFGWDRIMLEGIGEEARQIRELPDPYWSKKLNIPEFSPRYAMLHYGTEVMRTWLPDIWVLSLEKKLLQATNNIVVTDSRFINELQMLSSHSAKMTIVNRPSLIATYNHKSDIEWKSFANYSHTWNNTGTLDDLRSQVQQFVG